MIKWTFQPVFDSYLFVAATAIVLGALLWLRPTFGALSVSRRWILRILRGFALLLLLAGLLRPTLVLTRPLPQPASLVVLFDTSRSMELPDVRDSRSRWQSQRELLERIAPQLNELAPRLDIRIYGYDSQLHPIPLVSGNWQWPTQPAGVQTDIGSSLDEALQRELGRRVAAVILMGDGVQTAYDPKVEIYEAGRQLARLGAPLYAVAFGQAADVSESRDIAVESLPEQYTAFVQNELLIRGIVRVRGFANQTFPAALVIINDRGEETLVGPKMISVGPETTQLPVELSFIPQQPGQYKLILRIPPQSGELVTTNNFLTSFLTVLEGGIKVLYIYGNLAGEQRNLRWSLQSSPDINLRYLFIDPRNRSNWPDDRSALLQSDRYDVILLESVHASAFRQEDLHHLAQSVEKGSGLMMIGGYHSFGPGGYGQTPLRDVLPVEMDRLEQQDVNPLSPIRPDVHWMPEEGVTMLPVVPHPITRLAGEAENEAVWRKLPRLSGVNRLGRLKPTARLLAASAEGEPLLVAGQYGQGRVLAFAGDSTRLWWQFGYQAEHKRFWRQVILWLAHREEHQRSDVWIQLPQRRFPPGARIDVTLGARSPTGDPERDVQMTLILKQPDGTQQTIDLQSHEDHFSAFLRDLKRPGDYQLEATARRGDQVTGTAQLTFQIIEQDVELASVAADPGQLARLANLTRDVGGRLLAAEQLPGVLQELRQRVPEDVLQVQQRWRLADTLADAGILFLAMVALLSTEWFLRKRWGLV